MKHDGISAEVLQIKGLLRDRSQSCWSLVFFWEQVLLEFWDLCPAEISQIVPKLSTDQIHLYKFIAGIPAHAHMKTSPTTNNFDAVGTYSWS